jgi:hypothetical protein
MLTQYAAPTADQVCEDTSVFPDIAQSNTINDKGTTSLPVNTVANYKIPPTMNAGDACEICEVTTVLCLPH